MRTTDLVRSAIGRALTALKRLDAAEAAGDMGLARFEARKALAALEVAASDCQPRPTEQPAGAGHAGAPR